MAITTTDIKVIYELTATTDEFSFNIPFFDINDINVSVNDIDLINGLDFTVHPIGGDTSDGAIIRTEIAYKIGDIVVIYRDVEMTQEIIFKRGGNFNAKDVNDGLDRGIAISQQIGDKIERSLTFPTSDPDGLNYELASVDSRYGRLMTFDIDGNLIFIDESFRGVVSKYENSYHIGDGIETEFVLDFKPDTVNPFALSVAIDGSLQVPESTYTLTTTNIIFTSAPPLNSEISIVATSTEGTVDMTTGVVLADGTTTTRILSDKLSDIISVKDFGAVGDGISDDTVALQAAINSGAGVIDFSQGETYLISSTLLLDNIYRTELRMNGATIKTSIGVNIMRCYYKNHIIINGIFDGNSINATVLGIIIEDSCSGVVIRDCEFKDIGGCAIQVKEGASRAVIDNNVMDNCGKGASVSHPFTQTIFISGGSNVRVSNNTLTGCDWGIYFRGATSATPIDNYICINNTICGTNVITSQGISNQFGYSGVISGNIIADFHDNAIDSYGGDHLTISNNTAEECKGGIFVGHSGTNCVLIDGNTSTNCDHGIRVFSYGSGIIVSNNTCKNPITAGILVSFSDGHLPALDRVIVSGNIIDCIDSGVYGILLEQVSLVHLTNNMIYKTDKEGILIEGGDLIMVSRNYIQDSSALTVNTYDAIRADSDSNRSIIDYNVIYGGGKYAVSIDGGLDSSVRGNRWRSIGTGGILDNGTTTVSIDNIGI